MEVVQLKEDRIWELVFQVLAAEGRLLKFQRLPHHESKAYQKTYGQYATADLKHAYELVQQKRRPELDAWLHQAHVGRIYGMLHNLVGCMKCWVESESPNQSISSRWKVAHS